MEVRLRFLLFAHIHSLSPSHSFAPPSFFAQTRLVLSGFRGSRSSTRAPSGRKRHYSGFYRYFRCRIDDDGNVVVVVGDGSDGGSSSSEGGGGGGSGGGSGNCCC